MAKVDDLAYTAGRAAADEPADRRSVDSNPFEPGTSEATAWLTGFGDALDEAPDPAKLRKAIEEAKS